RGGQGGPNRTPGPPAQMLNICLTSVSIPRDNRPEHRKYEALSASGESMMTLLLLALLAGPAPSVDYARDVKPVLASRCTSCHGAIRQKAGLRLDTAALIRRGGQSGPAIEPGKSDESLLIERVTAAEESERMPPESEGVPLDAAEVGTLRAWI